MQPHPDFVGVVVPREASLGSYRLTPLTSAVVEEDYEAVMASASLLKGVFGDWPVGLTLSANLTDLHWHDREFTTNRSFSWVIRDATGAYLGCAYLFPEIGTRGKAQGVAWIRDHPDRASLATDIFEAFVAWSKGVVPNSVMVSFSFNPSQDAP